MWQTVSKTWNPANIFLFFFFPTPLSYSDKAESGPEINVSSKGRRHSRANWIPICSKAHFEHGTIIINNMIITVNNESFFVVQKGGSLVGSRASGDLWGSVGIFLTCCVLKRWPCPCMAMKDPLARFLEAEAALCKSQLLVTCRVRGVFPWRVFRC